MKINKSSEVRSSMSFAFSNAPNVLLKGFKGGVGSQAKRRLKTLGRRADSW
ncbi:MAG: hypothetical protein R2788_19790 [Saprospiraceae bacterium]